MTTSGRARSLLWRLGAFALAVTALSLVLHVAVISWWIRPLLEDTLAGQLAARSQLARSLIRDTPDAMRDQAAVGLSSADFQVRRGLEGQAQWLPGLPPPVGPALTRRLGPGFDLRHEPFSGFWMPANRLSIGFDVEGQAWHVMVHAQPPLAALLGTGIAWLMLAAAAVLASFLIGLRLIVGPLRDLAQRMAAQGSRIETVPLPAGASTEVRSLVESFNRLVDRVLAADRTKQHLLAGVSHDLRTPLARLRLRIETRCDEAFAAAAEEELHAIEHIVSQFLAYVHGDSGADLGRAESLVMTAEQVVKSYADQGVDVSFVVQGPDIELGALALQRVLTNLIDNALTHGAQPIEVTWLQTPDSARELSVWDCGQGMTQAQFGTAREPFVRLAKDTPIGHCGLGLAIVAQMAQSWGASLGCRFDDRGRFGILLTWQPGGAEAPGRMPQV